MIKKSFLGFCTRSRGITKLLEVASNLEGLAGVLVQNLEIREISRRQMLHSTAHRLPIYESSNCSSPEDVRQTFLAHLRSKFVDH